MNSSSAVPAGLYRHYKGGYYQVLGMILDATKDEPVVLYMAPRVPQKYFTRSIKNFMSTVLLEEDNGKQVPRFTLLEAYETPQEAQARYDAGYKR